MKDKTVEKLLLAEVKRQQNTIDLIPSENYASPDILKALGSPLTNKYSEGYPGKRYYPGNEYYDAIENLAKERALQVFKLKESDWSVNVQPYSGSPANLAIYSALMRPGETLMGMKLSAGGHLTHGHKVSATGQFYNSIQYGVNEKTGLLDYEEIAKLARQHKPKVIVSGLTAYPRKIDFKKFGEIAKETGAYHVADISHIAGLIAAGLHQSPFDSAQGKPFADVVMTTTHKTLRGPRGAVIFSRKSPLRTNGHPEARPKDLEILRSAQNDNKITIAESIDKSVFPGLQGGPHNNVIAATAIMFFEAAQPSFQKYQQQIIKNAGTLAEALMAKGFELITGGTDNHLMLVNVRKIGVEGLEAEKILEINGIIANRNTIPGDASPFKPSGVRMGTPAVTTRGMKEKEMKVIADLITRCLIKKENVAKEVVSLCKRFPLPY